jgi:subtilase family serine protease
VTVVAASGDYGAVSKPCPAAGAATAPVKEVSLPASDPLVLAAGGTNLRASHRTGAYISETALTTPVTAGHSYASGGGFSHLFTQPAYQHGVAGIGPAARGGPDVAADASGNTGMALAIAARGRTILTSASGTSAAAPLWAALIALADQYASRHLGFVNPALYRIARSTSYHHAFHDITTGTNTITVDGNTITGYRAAPGWDPVTGWGSPNARTLIPLLARYASPDTRPAPTPENTRSRNHYPASNERHSHSYIAADQPDLRTGSHDDPYVFTYTQITSAVGLTSHHANRPTLIERDPLPVSAVRPRSDRAGR